MLTSTLIWILQMFRNQPKTRAASETEVISGARLVSVSTRMAKPPDLISKEIKGRASNNSPMPGPPKHQTPKRHGGACLKMGKSGPLTVSTEALSCGCQASTLSWFAVGSRLGCSACSLLV